MKPQSISLLISISAGLLIGCGEPAQINIDNTDLLTIIENGTSINGVRLNGVRLNGVRLNGVRLNGIRLNGVRLNGVRLNGVRLNGSSLIGNRESDNTEVSGFSLAGAYISGEGSDRSDIPIYIQSVKYSPIYDLNLYTLMIPSDDGPIPVCGTYNGEAVPAVPVEGIFDNETGAYRMSSDQFTLGCVNASIGKCMLLGYRPSKIVKECDSDNNCRDQDLGNWLAACTRAVRADYCGDGVAHTRDGTPVNFWDNLGVQTRDITKWKIEAEWTTQGAKCIRHTRWLRSDPTSSRTDLDYVKSQCGQRLASSGDSDCDDDDSNFYSDNGLHTKTKKRKLLRTESDFNL